MKDKYKDIQKDYDELCEEKVYYRKYVDKLNDIIDDLRSKIEEETKIRKFFENKINNLHSIVRDKEAGYDRAKFDLDYLLQDNIAKNQELETLRENHKDLTSRYSALQIKFETTNHILTNTKKELESDKAYHHTEMTRISSELEALK